MLNPEKFTSLGISEDIIKALDQKGFEEPTPIQEKTIPLLLTGEKDVIGQAQTGTGKTAAFGIPILQLLESGARHPGALILSPTRELSIQIAEELNSLKGGSRLRIAPFYGGQPIGIQLNRLREGVDVVIGTPGRIQDLLDRKKLVLDEIQFAVLDEADEMLDMGFIEDIEAILEQTPEEKRMLMFSATMPKEILGIAEKFMKEHEVIRTKANKVDQQLTEQIYFEVRRENKLEALSRIIDMEPNIYAMVFCRTRTDVDELTSQLRTRGYSVDAIHGDIAQQRRTFVINEFKEKKFRILVATDVAARGIDVNDLTHVINYSIPQETETYVHRIGRTGRAGKTGTAITFVTPSEFRRLTLIKRDLNADIQKRKLPGPTEIIEAKKQRVAEKIQALIDDGETSGYLGFAEELLTLTEHPAQAIAALLRLKYKNEMLPEYYAEPEMEKKFSPDAKGNTKVAIGIGRSDGCDIRSVVELIHQQTGIKSSRLGKIELFDDVTIVSASYSDAQLILNSFQGKGKPSAELATPEQSEEAERHGRFRDDKRRDRNFPSRGRGGNDGFRKKEFHHDRKKSFRQGSKKNRD